MAFRLRGRVRPVPLVPRVVAELARAWRCFSGTRSAVPLGMTRLVAPLGEAAESSEQVSLRPVAGFTPGLARGMVVALVFRSVVGPRNVSKQHESCFVFEQTTGLVGLAVCESPHEVCTSFLPSVLSSQGRLEPCDLVGKANGVRRFQAPNYNSA